MKVIKFGIKSWEEGRKDFIEAYRAAKENLPYKPKIGTYFTSLEAARNFLTPGRLKLLRLIKEENPQSIYRLAHLAGRSFSAVFRDVETLKKHGLVSLSRSKDSPRRSVCPHVGYDAISLWIGI